MGHNGFDNGVGQEGEGGRMVLDKCFVSSCPASATAAIFLSDTAFQHVWSAPGLLMFCSCCRETPWEIQRDILKEGC